MTPDTTPLPTDRLALLALANFTIGMGAFVVIGVLSPVASAFGVDRAQAGWLMTVYAAVYAVLSPVLVSTTGRFDRKALTLAALGVFGAGALIAMLAPRFELLLLGRAVMALGGGLVTPVAASIGVALAGPGQQGRALAVVFGGLTLAQVLGVPVGAWLGYRFGWQTAFAVVVVLSALTAVAIALRLPAGIRVPTASLAMLGRVLGEGRLMTAVSFTAWFMGATYGVFTFLAPLLETRYGLARDGVTVMLLVMGGGAVVGNVVGGRLTDRIGPQRTLLGLCAVQGLFLPLMTVFTWPLPALALLMFSWSVSTWAFMVPQQSRLAGMSPAQVPVVFALNASAIYVGASIGSALGGASLRAWGFSALGPVAMALAVLGLLSLLIVARWRAVA